MTVTVALEAAALTITGLEAATLLDPDLEAGLLLGSPPTAVGLLESSVIGQTVVETATTSVVTEPILAGQLVTVGAHEVIV